MPKRRKSKEMPPIEAATLAISCFLLYSMPRAVDPPGGRVKFTNELAERYITEHPEDIGWLNGDTELTNEWSKVTEWANSKTGVGFYGGERGFWHNESCEEG